MQNSTSDNDVTDEEFRAALARLQNADVAMAETNKPEPMSISQTNLPTTEEQLKLAQSGKLKQEELRKEREKRIVERIYTKGMHVSELSPKKNYVLVEPVLPASIFDSDKKEYIVQGYEDDAMKRKQAKLAMVFRVLKTRTKGR